MFKRLFSRPHATDEEIAQHLARLNALLGAITTASEAFAQAQAIELELQWFAINRLHLKRTADGNQVKLK